MLASFIPSNLSKEERDAFESSWNSSKQIRDRLEEVFNGRLDKLIEDSENIKNFSKPKWQLDQAYRLGQRDMIRTFLMYLDQRTSNG